MYIPPCTGDFSRLIADHQFANSRNGSFSTQIHVSSKWDGEAVLFGGIPESFSPFSQVASDSFLQPESYSETGWL